MDGGTCLVWAPTHSLLECRNAVDTQTFVLFPLPSELTLGDLFCRVLGIFYIYRDRFISYSLVCVALFSGSLHWPECSETHTLILIRGKWSSAIRYSVSCRVLSTLLIKWSKYPSIPSLLRLLKMDVNFVRLL